MSWSLKGILLGFCHDKLVLQAAFISALAASIPY